MFRISVSLIIFYVAFFSNINSQNSPSWQSIPNAPFMQFGKFEDLYFYNNSGWVVSGIGSVYKTTDDGKTWTETIIKNKPYLRSICFVDSMNGWIGNLSPNFNDLIFETHDGGENWSTVTNLPDSTPPGICGMFVVDSVVYGCGRYSDGAGILKTSNKGATWQYVDLQQYASGLVDMYFFNPDSGFAVGMDTTNNHAVVLYTKDGGIHWEIKHTSAHQNEWAWKISFPSRHIGYVSLQTFNNSSYFLKTTDGGNSWVDLPNLGFTNFTPSGIGFANNQLGWQGPHPGFQNNDYIIETTDGGLTWTQNQNAKNVNKFRMINDTLGYACGETVYKYTSENLTDIKQPWLIVPTEYYLRQNFPNPFNTITTIQFAITKTELVNLSVIDVNGNLIKVLINQLLPSSDYEIRLNLLNLSSGVYFYQLKAGDFLQTKKMILMK